MMSSRYNSTPWIAVIFSSLLFDASFVVALAAAPRDAISPQHDTPKVMQPPIRSLQSPHLEVSPAESLNAIATACHDLGVDSWDTYGDFQKSPPESFLRKMEEEIAADLGMDDAVFMPSGVMAQSVALLVHREGSKTNAKSFGCHQSSHLLLHEAHAYRHLLDMEAVVINTQAVNGFVPPVTLVDVQEILCDDRPMSTLILELPHRELGGKLTPWQDVVEISETCRAHDIRFHCDGARLFEASAGYSKSLAELCQPFDSVYISFYKGLGGLSGAMLCGSADFCREARVWLRRMGGNLYTLLPYAVSGWHGYKTYWRGPESGDSNVLSFMQRKHKLQRVVAALDTEPVRAVVRFDPAIPETNMVHGYFYASVEECQRALDEMPEDVFPPLHRCNAIRPEDPAASVGFKTKFEWTMGEANGQLPVEVFQEAWETFASILQNTID